MTQVAISHIESGRTEPKWSTRELLADVLGYELTDVFPPSGKKSTSPELRKLLTEDLKKRKRAK